jgi:DHA1 family tetracycline resistance protein-like MFS transporter
LAIANTLPLLFIGRIIAGMCGASLTTGFAYTADISPPEKRAQNFGILSAAVGLGFIIGPFLGGVFSQFGTRAPFIAAAFLSLLNWLYGFFILPESLKPENRRIFSFKRANPFGAFIQFKKNKSIRLLLIAMFFLFMAAQVMPSIWPFYTKYLFNWSDLKIGYSLTFVGVMVAIVKGGLIKWTQQKIGPIRSVYMGLLFNLVGLSLFAFITQSWAINMVILIYCLGGIAPPSLQGIVSGRMPANEQGELQGVITSLLSLSNILSPLIMTHLFYFFSQKNTPTYFPGMPFLIAAAIILPCFLLCFRGLRR